MCFLSYF